MLLAMGLSAALVCARLGWWQLDRLEQRKARNAVISARLAAPAVEPAALLGSGSAGPGDLEFRRARLGGRFDLEREIMVVGRTLNGAPGVHVVTPLVLPSGEAVLVERGWAGAPDGRTVDLSGLREPGEVVSAGVLILPRGPGNTASERWPVRVRAADPAFLASRYPYPLLPVVLRRDSTPTGPLRPVPLPELTNGPHLSYAIQWFAFGLIGLVGSVVLARQQPRRAVDEGDPQRPSVSSA
jgi:surfeit locus 1 family protein